MGYYADLIKQKQEKRNSKEEKENYKLEKREEYKGYIIEVYETEPNKYIYLAYKKGSSSMHKYAYGDASSASEGVSRAKSALDVNNSKEEKDNAIPSGKRIEFDDDIVAVYNPQGKVIYKGIEDYDPHKRDDWRWDGSKGYYTNPAHPGFVKVCFRNEKEEEGYYAKLAEEKKQKQNWVISEEELKKFVRNNISRIKQEVKRRTAGKIEDISVFPDDLTAELFERGRTYRFKIVPNEAQGYEIKHLGRV